MKNKVDIYSNLSIFQHVSALASKLAPSCSQNEGTDGNTPNENRQPLQNRPTHRRKVSLTFSLSYSSKIIWDYLGYFWIAIVDYWRCFFPWLAASASGWSRRLCTAVRTQSLAHLHRASQLGQEALALQEIWVSLGPELLGDGEADLDDIG